MKPNNINTAIEEIDTLMTTYYRHGSQYPERAALKHLRERLIHIAETHHTPTHRHGAEYGRRPDPERI